MQTENAIDVTSDQWEEEVIKASLPVVVIFWAPWCQFCKALLPVFGDLAREYLGRMKFVRLNLEEHKELAEGYGLMITPPRSSSSAPVDRSTTSLALCQGKNLRQFLRAYSRSIRRVW